MAEILDFAIVSDVNWNHSVRTLDSLSISEHSPVLLTTRGALEAEEIKPNLIYSETDSELSLNYLVKKLSTQCLEENRSKR